MRNFLFRTIVKIIFGKLEPMKPEVESVVKELIFHTFTLGVLIGGFIYVLMAMAIYFL
jgi:hypothetical protein